MSDTFTSWRRQNIGALLLNLRRVRDLNPVSTPHCVRHRRNRVPYSHPTHMTQVMCFCSSPVNKQSYEKGSRKIVCLCGVYWTKFECISGKIRRILPANRTRGARGGSEPLRTLRLRGEANQCASDTLADSRVQKPKNFLAFFSRLPPHPSAAKRKKKWKGFFWFCFAVSVSEKSNLILTFLFALFSTLTATEAPPISTFSGSSNVRIPHTTAYA